MTTLFHESRTVRGTTTEGLTVTSVYRCVPYTDYPAGMAQLLGGVSLVGGRLVRTLPLRDSIHPWLFCQEVEVAGVGNFLPTAPAPPDVMLAAQNYYDEGARLTCTFRPYAAVAGGKDGGVDSGTAGAAEGDQTTNVEEVNLALADESFDLGAQSLTLPNRYLQWQNADAPAQLLANQQTQAAKVFPQIHTSLTRHHVLSIMKVLTGRLVGCVNKYNIFGWPSECVRFDGIAASRKVTTTDVPYIELTTKWAIQLTYDVRWKGPAAGDVEYGFVGWNRFFNPANHRWEYAAVAGEPARRAYRHDVDAASQNLPRPGGGTDTVAGFLLLFDPRATDPPLPPDPP